MGKIKTLLINPVIGFSPPFCLFYLAAALEKQNHEIAIEELNTYGQEEFAFNDLMRRIVENAYNFIGITCLSSHTEVVKRLIKDIRKNFPSVKIAVGGTHASALPEEFLDIGADIAVLGEGESIFLQVVENLERGASLDDIPSLVIAKNGSYLRTRPRTDYENVKNLPWPAYHLINMEHYFANNYAIRGYWLRCGWIFTSRGCPGRCTFCASAITHGYPIREREIKDVVDELEYLKKKYKIEAFWILDDTFVVKENRVIEFCDEIARRKLNLVWACQARVNFITEKIVEALKNSGCVQIDLGIESGSQKVLNAMKKGITTEQIKRAFSIVHRYKLRALGTIMIGCPEETWEDINATRNILKEAKPDYLGIGFCTPYPGTELYEQAIEKGWLNLKNLKWSTEGHNAKPIMFINFTEKELYKIYDSLVASSFYKTIFSYLKQRKFLQDLLRTVFLHPRLVCMIVWLSAGGRRKDAINLFRKFRITGNI